MEIEVTEKFNVQTMTDSYIKIKRTEKIVIIDIWVSSLNYLRSRDARMAAR